MGTSPGTRYRLRSTRTQYLVSCIHCATSRYSNHLPVGTHSSMLPYLYFNLPPARWLGLAFSPPNVPIEILRIFTCLVSGVMPHVSRCTSSKNCSGNRQPLHLHASIRLYMDARKLIRDGATAKQQKTDRHKFPVYALRFSAYGTVDSKLSLPD
ncbi:hypothetical protein J3E68DRAFT_344243 [Trichoderma sp. SZMC 28012]